MADPNPNLLYEASGIDENTGRSYEVNVHPDDNDDHSDASHSGALNVRFQCQFYRLFEGVQDPLLYHYDNHIFGLTRVPTATNELSSVDDVLQWLVHTAGVPQVAADSAVVITRRFYAEFPRARNTLVLIKVNEAMDGEEELLDVAGEEDLLEVVLRRSEEEAGSGRAVPASRAAVEALEKVVIVSESKMSTSCVVCLGEFSVGYEATRMPCSHVFHGDCIVKSLEYRPFCPVCRFELPSETN